MDTSGPGTGREKVSLALVRAGERLPRSSHGFFLFSCQRANRASAWAERNYYSSCSIEIKKNLRAFTPESPGLVHHSDRGVQYASAEYVQVLREHGMELSMSRAHNPYDNATCESFIKTLKVEEIYVDQYQDLEDLRQHVQEFIEQYYNRCRLHSALGYRSPEKFEQQLAATPAGEVSAAAIVSFSGMGKSSESCRGKQAHR